MYGVGKLTNNFFYNRLATVFYLYVLCSTVKTCPNNGMPTQLLQVSIQYSEGGSAEKFDSKVNEFSNVKLFLNVEGKRGGG